MPREFIDRNIFYAGYEKSEIKERTLHTAGGGKFELTNADLASHADVLRLVTSSDKPKNVCVGG